MTTATRDYLQQIEATGCTVEVDDIKATQTYTVDIWAPDGKYFSSNGTHVISHGFFQSTAYSAAEKQRVMVEALADLQNQTIEECEDDECEYCAAR